MDTFVLAACLTIMLVLGVLVGASWAAARARADVAQARAALTAVEQQWAHRALTAEARADQADQVAMLVAPLRQSLAEVQASLRQSETARAAGVGRVEGHLQTIAAEQRAVAQQTSSVVAALRNPGVRGRWGEVALTRIIESAGLLEGISFQTQTGEVGGRLRPDMVVDLGAGRRVVIDAKVPLDALITAYEDAGEAGPDHASLRAHAAAVRARVRDLAGKNYASELDHTPDFVVLFLPADELLTHALRADATLVEDAAGAGVILATPTTLLTLLRVVALTWREERAHMNAAELLELASQAVDRVGMLAGHLQALGGRLDATLEAYNKVAGSWQSRIRPVARRLAEFGSDWEAIPEFAPLDTDVRRVDRLTDTA
ncbi:MAG: recombination protein RmuC [Actinomycetota bacterium]|nr:recombination protein RmuC [Actinomycetota bacterium]